MMRVTNILFFLDEEPASEVLDRVGKVAEGAGAKVTLAAVVEPARSHAPFAKRGLDPDKVERLLVEDCRSRLEDKAAHIGDSGVEVATRVFIGDPVETLLQAAKDREFDLLAKEPSPSQGLRQQLFGSVDMQLMRACPCPVLIGRPKTEGYSGRAVAAVSYDVGDDLHARLNHEILDAAAFVLKTQFAAITEVHVVHAWKMYGESLLASGRGKLPADEFKEALRQEEEQRKQWLANLIDNYLSRTGGVAASGFEPTMSLLHGDPKVVIPELVTKLDADLLAMGTVSRGGIGGLFIGNTAEEILNRVNCSVVTRRPA